MNVDINPKPEVLDSLGLSEVDFNHALVDALDRLEGKPVWDLPIPTDIPILFAGQQHRLGDLASIDVSYARLAS